ncbi:myeloid-associated differentiation marker-like protein 2 [Clavelina lepadiformis]|uniref:MARVEL domain-containing protein n=1 Tax=Clavelina lepadiformis TaxID=159417 RepID=A0ABP0G6R3_CLALP
MATTGVAYLTSKEGIVKAAAVMLGCITFALVIESGYSRVIVVLAVYILCWVLSTLSYIFFITNLEEKLPKAISYEAANACLSVGLFFMCLIASAVLAMTRYWGKHLEERIAAGLVGFVYTAVYAGEVYLLKGKAPKSLDFLWGKMGLLKVGVCVSGCLSFALLDASDYRCYHPDGCNSARICVLVSYILSWGGSVVILIFRSTPLPTKFQHTDVTDFIWSTFSFLNYLLAAVVLTCYLKCVAFDSHPCGTRLSSVFFGFVTAGLYAIEAYYQRDVLGGNATK